MTDPNSQNPAGVLFSLEKLYVKDSSFEAPNAPQVFLATTAPAVSVQIGIGHSAVDAAQGLHEVVLSVTIDAKNSDKSVFLAEVHQAGLFRITGLPNEELPKALEIAAPNVLLPFARQAVNALVESGGFPQLLINPINFEMLYLQKQQAAASAPAPAAAH
jgi:preprotein translocase subunit SecB